MTRRIAAFSVLLALVQACRPTVGGAPPAPPALSLAIEDSRPTLRERLPSASSEGPADLVLVLVSGARGVDRPAKAGALSDAEVFLGDLQGYRFDRAYAQSSSAFISLGSLFTGRYPASIPLCGFYTSGYDGLREDPTLKDVEPAWCARLPHGRPTLAEVMALYGYRTALFSSGLLGVERLSQGFEHVEELPERGVTTDWGLMEERASAWWLEDSSRPRLLVVLSSDLQIARRADLKERMRLIQAEGSIYSGGPFGQEAVLDRVWGVYRAEARRVGGRVAALIGSLPAAEGQHTRPRWVAVSSTNGLSMLERWGFHVYTVPALTTACAMERTTHVPLLLCPPGSDCVEDPSGLHERVQDPVELLDLLPTLAGLAGALPPANLPGQDLLGARLGDTLEGDPELLPSLPVAWSEFGDTIILRQGDFLLQYRGWVHNSTSVDPMVTQRLLDPRILMHPRRWGLFDVVRDPLQERDLRLERPRLFAQMRAKLTSIRQGVAAPPPLRPEQSEVFRLTASQGYW